METVRVIRVLEYTGPRDVVEMALHNRGVKCTVTMSSGLIIREVIVGDFPEVVEEEKKPISNILSINELKFMQRFGWEVLKSTGEFIKRDLETGKVLAHEGDETWTRDLKVAGE